ncbi:hypothetical protein [Vibrio variabilis]|uniref:hypothetical protein n=1 Tax=Vibrio variabilis TaxID=990271 RepID=UPI0013A6EAE7|nr:hypothetical protein [Vibrio variabilis]
MKRILLGLGIVAVLLAAGGGVAYYFGYFDESEPPQTSTDRRAQVPQTLVEPSKIEEPTPEPKPLPKQYYVSRSVETVYLQPESTSTPDGVAYYGEQLNVMERRGDWIRIAPIYQLEEGADEVSQWVNSAHLSVEPVKLSGSDWLDILQEYIENSDNYMSFQEAFLDASTQLINSKQCRLADFEEVGGWIKSINHKDSVYFTYCGGIEAEHKIYLNVASGEIF